METSEELPDLPPNTELLEFLRAQACLPSGPDDYALGSWQLHTHPDLMELLRNLAPGWPVTEAYGVPLLACEGIAAVVALGTDFLVVRVDSLPPEVDTKDPAPEWSFVHEGWHVISPWQSRLPGADAEHAVKGLVSAALTHAARLAQA